MADEPPLPSPEERTEERIEEDALWNEPEVVADEEILALDEEMDGEPMSMDFFDASNEQGADVPSISAYELSDDPVRL